MKPLNKNVVRVARLLSDGEYHDGTSIGKRTHISRTAVWKVIRKLKRYGIPFTSTKGRGYQMASPLILLDEQKLKSKLRHRSVQLHILESTASTNDYLKKCTKANKHIVACMAEIQTAGRGRLERTWHSPFAENIYLSVLCPFEKDMSELSGLSLVVGLAVCRAIERVLDLKNKLSVKWPNDILVEGCKLAGNLIEAHAESNGFTQVIMGIGVNVNMLDAPAKSISQSWTSLRKITNQYIDRNIICAEIIDTLIDYLEIFSQKGLSHFVKEWQAKDHLMHANISILSGKQKIQGKCIGINEHGHLLLKTKNGKTSVFSSGDTTLLKTVKQS